MKESLATFLTQYPIVTLFGVIGVGYLLGQARIFGFRLGVAGVLFAGLAAGSLGPEVALPSIVSTVGLILFIYCIGIQFGPTFTNPGLRTSVFCLAMLSLGALLAWAVSYWHGFEGPVRAGLFSGALTNAPALAAAQEILRDNYRSLTPSALQQLIDRPVISFGIAYPFGVLGVMLSLQLYRKIFRIKSAPPAAGDSIEVRDFIVQNPGVAGDSLSSVFALHSDLGFVVSRIRHNGSTALANAESRLELGDVVAAVGNHAALERARQILVKPPISTSNATAPCWTTAECSSRARRLSVSASAISICSIVFRQQSRACAAGMWISCPTPRCAWPMAIVSAF